VLEAWFANKFRAIAIEQSDHTMLLRILPSRLFRHVPELNVVARREERLRERFNSTGVVVPAASVHVGRELQSNGGRIVLTTRDKLVELVVARVRARHLVGCLLCAVLSRSGTVLVCPYSV